MSKRPISVTVISCVLIAAATIGLAYHLIEFSAQHQFHYDMLWVSIARLTAIVGGVFMLRGNNWARWLSLGWIAYHVVLGAFHSLHQFVVHGLLLAVFAYFLLRPRAAEYFHAQRTI